jgi:hypothetical protein
MFNRRPKETLQGLLNWLDCISERVNEAESIIDEKDPPWQPDASLCSWTVFTSQLPIYEDRQ